MCGRYANSESIPAIAARWSAAVADGVGDWTPSDDVRPTQRVPVLLEGPNGRPRRIGLMRWGWARDFAASGNLFNARSEEAGTKATFAEAMKGRRCLVPATAWFEWQANPAAPKGKKTKHRLAPVGVETWALAGLWEPVRAVDGTPAGGAVVVMTTAAHPSIAQVHDRMPCIISIDTASAWLAGGAVPGAVVGRAETA